MLKKLAPSDWAICYFITILIFSGFYLALSGDFHQSTSQIEPSIQYDQNRIAQEINIGLKDSPQSRSLYKEIGGENIYVESIYVHEDFLHKLIIREKTNDRVLFGTASIISAGPKPTMSVLITKFESPAITENQIRSDVLFRYQFEIDRDYYIWIHGLKASIKGKPTRSTGVLVRMLYLSVVTQTTLGFGDIVPLTDLTRILVALQSILGIIMAGGFISSVMRDKKS